MAGKNTFWKLISEYQIEIPVIQRDYAQGRKSAKAIRNNFIASMENALAFDTKMDMNFVYGSIEDGRQFIPIDGQQRLTTLFLLHMYLIQATGKNPLDYPELKKFTYKTRISSTYFCTALSEHKLAETVDDFKNIKNLRAEIVDKAWFGTSWQNDPTVDAMLNMLQTIHEVFGKRDDLDELLTKLMDYDKCPLYFYFLNLGEYSLEDSIYIKMNARGKALTDYENFKAKLEKFFKDRNVDKWEELAASLDREWTELFWTFVDDAEFEKPNGNVNADYKMMNFIVNYIYNDFANYTVSEKRDDLRREIDWLFGLTKVEFTNLFSSFDDKFKDYKIEQSFVDLFTVFSLMTEGNQIKEYAPNNGYFVEKDIFTSVLDPKGVNGFTPQIRVLFYAYTQFLLVNKDHIADDDFSAHLVEWFRVMKHLIDGQYFMGLDEYVHVIKGVHWLAGNSYDILTFLGNLDLEEEKDSDSEESEGRLPYFNKYVFAEEQTKARLILLSDEWKNAVAAAEKNGYFNGDINGALEFSGITMEATPVLEWTEDVRKLYLDKFQKYTNLLDAIFNSFDTNTGLKADIANVFRRALLTKGDFTMRYRQNQSMLVDESNLRGDVTWRRLFKPQRGQEYITKRGYVKALLDDPLFDIKDIAGSCQKIVDAYSCDDLEWKYFIEIPEVMQFVIREPYENGSIPGKNKDCWNFFRNSDDTKFLLWSTRLSGWNFDYYKYALYRVLLREKSPNVLQGKVKSGINDVINEPIYIKVAEDDVYEINLVRDTKQYRITGGKNSIDVTKDSLDDMVKYVKENNLLDYVSSEQTIE